MWGILKLLMGLFDLVSDIIQRLPKQKVIEFADGLLDYVEDFGKREDTIFGTWDDSIIAAGCAKVRETFNIPDNDEPAEG